MACRAPHNVLLEITSRYSYRVKWEYDPPDPLGFQVAFVWFYQGEECLELGWYLERGNKRESSCYVKKPWTLRGGEIMARIWTVCSNCDWSDKVESNRIET